MLTGYYGIEQVPNNTPGAFVCGECNRAWLEDIVPGARCAFEFDHGV